MSTILRTGGLEVVVVNNARRKLIETVAILPVYAHGAVFDLVEGEMHITSYLNQLVVNGTKGQIESVVVNRLIFSEAHFWEHSHAVQAITRPRGFGKN